VTRRYVTGIGRAGRCPARLTGVNWRSMIGTLSIMTSDDAASQQYQIRSAGSETKTAAMSANREYRSRAKYDADAGSQTSSAEARWEANKNDAKRMEMRVYAEVGSHLAWSSSPVVLR
jgi:hypothetical protein